MKMPLMYAPFFFCREPASSRKINAPLVREPGAHEPFRARGPHGARFKESLLLVRLSRFFVAPLCVFLIFLFGDSHGRGGMGIIYGAPRVWMNASARKNTAVNLTRRKLLSPVVYI